jgi:hypothetical protein
MRGSHATAQRTNLLTLRGRAGTIHTVHPDEIHQREESVLVDHRTYRIKPGAMNAYLDNYEKFGLVAQTRHLGQPVAYMFSESGEINTLVHIWAYEDAADRMKRRAAMQADAEWQVFVRKNAEGGNLVQQTTMLMVPAKFAPIKR